MKVLAIETSCDETSASVLHLDKVITVNSICTSSSLQLHATTGGIIPEQAARAQVTYMMPVIVEALCKSNHISEDISYEKKFMLSQEILQNDIDALAVTIGPGLIGSLLVGVETAKTLSYALKKPLIPVNHLLGHIYANFIDKEKDTIQFPFIGLIVSGGHTDLLLFNSHNDYKLLGGTRDDAAGEALDKVGRLLGLSYPAGPQIEINASHVVEPTITFTSPMIHEKSYEFSFSGLKTEAQREIKKLRELTESHKNHVCYALQKAVFDVLIKKTLRAADDYGAKSILLGGGVAANQTLVKRLTEESSIPVFIPKRLYCTDNAAMIGAYALLNNQPQDWKTVSANPELYFK